MAKKFVCERLRKTNVSYRNFRLLEKFVIKKRDEVFTRGYKTKSPKDYEEARTSLRFVQELKRAYK